MRNKGFPWSDNWWIEDDRAWFCAGEIAALFCVDMNNWQCEFVAQIPECSFNNFRLFSYCMKYRESILCLPNMGKCIWCYDLKTLQWEKIDVESDGQIFICSFFNSKSIDKIFFWNLEGEVFELNLVKRILEKKYSLTPKTNEEIGEYVLVGNELYCVLGKCVHCINIDNGKISSYVISDAKADLYTICFDGSNFWLSGFCKEIYVWNLEKGVVKIITEFPEWFGIYNFNGNQAALIDCDSFYAIEYPFFYSSVSLGKYVWFIPMQTNEIIYIDKDTYDVFVLHIDEEKETWESLNRHRLASKFLVEYIREERYIGLYSIKNKYVFEIDTVDLCVKDISYYLSDKTVLRILREATNYSNRKILKEYREMDRRLYSILLENNNESRENMPQNKGKLIYRALDR